MAECSFLPRLVCAATLASGSLRHQPFGLYSLQPAVVPRPALDLVLANGSLTPQLLCAGTGAVVVCRWVDALWLGDTTRHDPQFSLGCTVCARPSALRGSIRVSPGQCGRGRRARAR